MYELHVRLGKWKPATTKRAQTTQSALFWALGMPFPFFSSFFNILTNDLEIPTLKQSHPISMPRANSKQHLGTQFYEFSNSPCCQSPLPLHNSHLRHTLQLRLLHLQQCQCPRRNMSVAPVIALLLLAAIYPVIPGSILGKETTNVHSLVAKHGARVRIIFNNGPCFLLKTTCLDNY